MMKIAVGPAARGSIDLRESASWNLERIAERLGKNINDLMVMILDRPRHADLINECREAGACIRLIGDGDVSAAIATAQEEAMVDVMIGTGGAPEGVIAAAALRCLGGELQGRLIFRNDDEKKRASSMGITDFDKIYGHEELATGKVMFVATGVTHGTYLKGVRYTNYGASTHSIVMRSETGTVREIKTKHHFALKPNYGW